MAGMNNRLALWRAPALNLGAIAVLLWVAVGITCEITIRNEDYGRIVAYQKWLLNCESSPGADKTCPNSTDPNDLRSRIEYASAQVRRYNDFNVRGASDRCSIPAVFASSIGGFFEDCIKVMSSDSSVLNPVVPKGQRAPTTLEIATYLTLQNKDQLQVYKQILSPDWFSYSGIFALDQRSKEPLYFCLVLIAAMIGSLTAGLRSAGITTIRDVALGLGAGFAVYIVMRSGNFVFLAVPETTHVDILNPFTTGAVGFFAGLFNDRAFALMDAIVARPPAPVSKPAESSASASVAARAAIQAAKTALVNAKAHEGTPSWSQAWSDAQAAFQKAEDEVNKLLHV